MREIEKVLFKGEINKVDSLIKDCLNEVGKLRYGDIFIEYFKMMKGLQECMRPEEYINILQIVEASLTVTLKKAYRERDIEAVKEIKELLQIVKDFNVGDIDDIL
ncbi:hypothetical protein [Persephonella sp.]